MLFLFYSKLPFKTFRPAIYINCLCASYSDCFSQALRALLAMAPVCLAQFRSDGSLLDSLLTLRDQYQDMVQSEMILGEENGYFSEMLELVNALELKMK